MLLKLLANRQLKGINSCEIALLGHGIRNRIARFDVLLLRKSR